MQLHCQIPYKIIEKKKKKKKNMQQTIIFQILQKALANVVTMPLKGCKNFRLLQKCLNCVA